MAQKVMLSPLTPAEKERIFQDTGPAALPLRLIGDCALTVEEAASLRWEDVDLDSKTLSVSGRKVPIYADTAHPLSESSRKGPYVLPSARDPQTPVNRAALSRQVRQALDKAGFSHLDASSLRTLRILELLETCPIEEVSRATGYEIRSLRALWSRYRQDPLPARPRKYGAPQDDSALLAALEREGDTLAARAVWLSWQGGLTVKAMLQLTWVDVSLLEEKWVVQGKAVEIPGPPCPLLRRWEKADGGQGPVLRGVSSQTTPELAFLVRRVSEFFLREGLEGFTLAGIRGNGKRPAMIEQIKEMRGPVTAAAVSRKMGVSKRQAEQLVRDLKEQGTLEPDNRARFSKVLSAHKGELITASVLREEVGLPSNIFYYYVKGAVSGGELKREKHGLYKCL